MSTRLTLEFNEASTPVTEPVTKFGGQPHWLDAPQWPLSRSTRQPMRFICQVRLPDTLGQGPMRMAYLFMTDGEDYVDETWEPDGGENAVVVQPAGRPPSVECSALREGPTLCRMVQSPSAARLTPEPCEFRVTLSPREEPDFVPEDTRWTYSEDQTQEYYSAIGGNKLGGTPMFMQSDEFPPGGPWRLLLQLDSTTVPFSVNFGDAGIGYAFISDDGTEGRFLWQCA